MAMNRRHGNQSIVVGRNKQRNVVEESIVGVVVIVHDFEKSGPGKSASIQIYSGTELDPTDLRLCDTHFPTTSELSQFVLVSPTAKRRMLEPLASVLREGTGNGKTSKTAKLKEWRSKKKSDGSRISNYKVKLKVEKGFGNPAAFVITNEHKHKFYLKSAFLQIPKLHPQIIHFDCNSWVYPFNVAAPPRLFFSNTSYIPSQTPRPLVELRKEELIKLRGDGKRENKEWERIYEYDYYDEFSRPELGESSSHPYPRRGRTVQHPNSDVPPDERMRQSKVKGIVSSSVEAALQFLIPTLKAQHYTTNHFNSFKFPPESKAKVVSTIKASDIEHNLDGLPLQQAIEDRRIFMLDHHDYLMPFLNRINSSNVFAYASRTLLFLRTDSTLKPLAIELSLPYSEAEGGEISWVYLPAPEGLEAALWQLAKAHVAANDSVYHQLVSHWLHTHAVVEPFIIATRRQLSVMHPVYKLLNPHFKDTMHINSLFRSFLLKPDGIFEKILFSGQFSMELSSELYKEWRFNEHGLPADLLKRNMAIRDPDPGNLTGVQLIFPDYPYAEDGLEIWTAIKTWVKSFCSIFYRDDDSVHSDEELQAWWSEIRNVGHGHKFNESGWYELTTLSDLVEALTTLIWTATGLHAAVNSGQYAYASYPLNRPTLCHKFIPSEGTAEYAEFLSDPDKYYLEMLPGKFETALTAALTEVLSHHAKDELYLGRMSSHSWTDNARVRHSFSVFSIELKNIEKRIAERNKDPNRKNRSGPAKIPYELLFPDTSNVNPKGGITGKGIPNSISM
ncbi:Linoleate 9S-lipoxygenase 5, chloroplastic [Cucurbita argyrosperma subsp. argyrosperma]|nr:Linoleate 9S-lipoxygenase 5, chloroplastic [Cucurbita argyrosperma subsp. argyrosperma]